MTDIYTALSWAALFWQMSSQISTLHCIGRPGDIIRTEIFTALSIAIIQISLPCPAQVYTVQVHTAYISVADIYNTAQKQQTSLWQIFENASTSLPPHQQITVPTCVHSAGRSVMGVSILFLNIISDRSVGRRQNGAQDIFIKKLLTWVINSSYMFAFQFNSQPCWHIVLCVVVQFRCRRGKRLEHILDNVTTSHSLNKLFLESLAKR